MNITVTTVASLWAVQLEATDTVGTVRWWRVEGPRRILLPHTGPIVVDREIPLNTPVAYIATDDTTTRTSDLVEVTADQPILASTLATKAVPVTVIESRPYAGEGRSRWHPVLGRTDPFVTIAPATYPAGQLRFLIDSDTARRTLIDLMTTGHVLLLRSTCTSKVDTMHVVMTRWSDPWLTDYRGLSQIVMDFQRVTDVPDPVPPAPLRTFQTVKDTHDDFGSVADTYTDMAHLRDGNP